MSRGKSTLKPRTITPDARHSSVTVAKFINYVMLDGKKSIATRIVYQALELAGKKLNADPLEVLETAVKNAAPILEVKGRRIGGANYQIPMEVPRIRRQTLAMKWIIQAARNSQGKPMQNFLAEELENAYRNQGTAMKKKDEMHRMAEANKAFAHFARFS